MSCGPPRWLVEPLSWAVFPFDFKILNGSLQELKETASMLSSRVDCGSQPQLDTDTNQVQNSSIQ